MKNIIGLLCFLTMVVSLVADNKSSAVVTFVKGKVYVNSPSKKSKKKKWKRIQKGSLINSGDTIKTGNGSMVTLNYRKSEFKVQPNTTLVVESLYSKEKSGSVKVEEGSSWFNIKGLGNSKFFSNTPTSVVAVRGTAFATIYSKKGERSMNCVCEGSVEVQGQGILKKGMGGMLQKGKPSLEKTSYKDMISKIEEKGKTSIVALPKFKTYVKKFPEMKSCLACHTPKGWKWKGIAKDNTYGN